jgi:hypothetical protein
MLPSLDRLLEFRHPPLIRSFMRTHGAEEGRAIELFEDMLKYLWISCKQTVDQEQNPSDESLKFLFVMHEEMREIDNMWHNFILYTKDYTDFCHRYFGSYLHHQPDIAETIVQTEGEFSAEMEKYLSYVFDHLGEATVRRWFAAHL